MDSRLEVLLVGDPNLGDQGAALLTRYFRHLTTLKWSRGDRAAREKIRQLILKGRWDLMISFYNDFLFSTAQLARADIALNIHPGLPTLPGVGYDTLPLIEGHSEYGATLHFMTPEIDAGKIVHVTRKNLPPGTSYREFRPMTQAACVEMLGWLASTAANCASTEGLLHTLETRAQLLALEWQGEYISRAHLRTLLARVKAHNPRHRVFQ